MDTHKTRWQQQRGSALAVTLGVAFICSVAAYTILILARSQVGPAKIFRERLRARYAAEAGVVWAQAQLWRDPEYSNPEGGAPDFSFMDSRGTINVDVIVPPCPGSPCAGYRREVRARVVY